MCVYIHPHSCESNAHVKIIKLIFFLFHIFDQTNIYRSFILCKMCEPKKEEKNWLPSSVAHNTLACSTHIFPYKNSLIIVDLKIYFFCKIEKKQRVKSENSVLVETWKRLLVLPIRCSTFKKLSIDFSTPIPFISILTIV